MGNALNLFCSVRFSYGLAEFVAFWSSFERVRVQVQGCVDLMFLIISKYSDRFIQ